jgi:anti-sigma regulatory factor (Ser/Thr protein kinase)
VQVGNDSPSFGALFGRSAHATSGGIQHFLCGIFGAANMSTRIDLAVRIRHAEHVRLAALVSSVGCSRVFVRGICTAWQLETERIEVAQLLTSELVSNAIMASGVTGPLLVHGLPYADLQLIGLRLLALDDSLVIQVWDTSPKPPKLLTPPVLLEHGRGLQLVDALSIRWGYYHAPISGKVVWCQLALNAGDLEQGTDEVANADRVLEALASRPWDEDT